MTIAKNQHLFKEGAEADGVYLLVKGSVVYQKKFQIEMPVDASTNNKWFIDEVKV